MFFSNNLWIPVQIVFTWFTKATNLFGLFSAVQHSGQSGIPFV